MRRLRRPETLDPVEGSPQNSDPHPVGAKHVNNDVQTLGTASGASPKPPAATAGMATLAAAGGAAVGMGAGTAYALGIVTGVCPVCGVIAGVGLLGYGIYQLATGGAEQLVESGERIANGEGTTSDYFALGSLIGGLASGRVAKGAFGTGVAHGRQYGTAPMWMFMGAGGPGAWVPRNESMSARAQTYQNRMGGRTGEAYKVNGVHFDSYQNGVLIEAKGPGYNNFVRNGEFAKWWGGRDGFVDQARRQAGAAAGTPIQWHFAANMTRTLFDAKGVSGIEIIVSP